MNEKPIVLVIDDQKGTLVALDMILQDACQVLRAASGKEGVELLKKNPVEVVFTDIHMPDLNGLEVLRMAKQIDPMLEVVMVTGYANLDTAKKSLRLGAFDYVSKPFDAGHICEIAQEAISKRRKAKEVIEQLQKLQKQKETLEGELVSSERLINAGRLTCGVIHEMNNPLTVIQGYVEILMKKLNNNGHLCKEEYEEYQHFLKTVENQVQQCREIALGFLSFIRNSHIEPHPLQLNLMLAELSKMMSVQGMGHQVAIELHADQELPEIPVHIGLIKQVFVNLMMNAVYAMPQGGRLDIFTQDKGDEIEIRLEDTGTGIAPENMAKLFQTFFTTKEGGKGSGLGLAISKQIVERHGGAIFVKSELGKGTTFTVRLPKQLKVESAKGAA